MQTAQKAAAAVQVETQATALSQATQAACALAAWTSGAGKHLTEANAALHQVEKAFNQSGKPAQAWAVMAREEASTVAASLEGGWPLPPQTRHGSA
jgi:Lon protease-like protein